MFAGTAHRAAVHGGSRMRRRHVAGRRATPAATLACGTHLLALVGRCLRWRGRAGTPYAVVCVQAEGYTELITQLCVWLQEITGFHTISLQPNSGSNGECHTPA